MKFSKKKVDGFIGTEVRFKCDVEVARWEPFEIVATKMGIHLTGRSPIMASPSDLQTFAKAIGDASHEFMLLKKAAAIVTHESVTQ